VDPSCLPGCVLEVVVIKLDAWERKRFLKNEVKAFFAILSEKSEARSALSFNKTNIYASARRDAQSISSTAAMYAA
jgi:hypothetical protein